MSLKHSIRRALAMPPNVLVSRVLSLLRREAERAALRLRDTCLPTYSASARRTSATGTLLSYLPEVPAALLKGSSPQIMELAALYCSHRFDLLGSGWVQVRYGMRCRGLETHRFAPPISGAADGDEALTRRINHANRRIARRIRHLIGCEPSRVDSRGAHLEYVPIDWHRDFKSGFRWSERTWYLKAGIRRSLGADIKVPWELARMQHLSQLAWAYVLSRADAQEGLSSTDEAPAPETFHDPEVYAREFRNQVLDFIAANPPRFGVNWHCTMDVGIRVVNWLVAYDLFRANGARFDREFEEAFIHSVYDHGKHIVTNLEWYEGLRSNHYLSNIVGLLFVAAYLPRTTETDCWLALAVQELLKEVPLQFNPDGSNFEASTSYHRLSAEMVVYGTALILGLPPEKQAALQSYNHRRLRSRPSLKPCPIPLVPSATSDLLTPFPDFYLLRLQKMAEFIVHTSYPDGRMPQIGDNDSGRLMKLHCRYDAMSVGEAKGRYLNLADYDDLPEDAVYWDENLLDHRHVVAAVSGLFQPTDSLAPSGEGWIDRFVVRHLAKGVRLPSYRGPGEPADAERVRVGPAGSSAESCFKSLLAKTASAGRLRDVPEDHLGTVATLQHSLMIPAPGQDLRDGLTLCAYPDFGYYLFRSHRLYLGIRCGNVGQNGNGGHAHNDQLSVELLLDGKPIFQDPGAYLYTPLPDRRNAFRSTAYHFTPQVAGKEMNDWPADSAQLFRLPDRARATCLYFAPDGFVGRHMGFGHPVIRLVRLHREAVEIVDVGGSPPPEAPEWYSNGYGRLLRSSQKR